MGSSSKFSWSWSHLLLLVFLFFCFEVQGMGMEMFPIEEPSDVAWVVQISDLHVSAYHPQRAQDLKELLAPALKIIYPSLVLITGDLTDAKNRDHTTTRQDEYEWIEYKKRMDFVIKKSGIEKRAFFDIRGNHDTYGVPYAGSYWDFFSKYSISAQLNRTRVVQSTTLIGKLWKYQFIGVDDTMSIGLRGPSNLFGHPNNDKIQEVDSQLEFWDTHSEGNVSKIVFGHFPMSFTASTETGKRYESVFAKHSVSYICGHLHAKFGKQLWKYHMHECHKAPSCKGANKQGHFWEWEAGDWRESRLIRVIAIDRGHTSFVDVNLSREFLSAQKGLQPIILATYPPDSRLLVRGSNSLNLTSKDVIRGLVFSEKPVHSVSAKVFDSSPGYLQLVEEMLLLPVTSSRENFPLYQTPWNSSRYSDASPTRFWLQITVTDNAGTETTSMLRPFSIDGKQSKFNKTWLASLLMDVRWDLLYRFLLWTNFIFLTLLLLLPKLLSYYLEKRSLYRIWVISVLKSCTSRTRKALLIPLWVLIEGSRNTKLWCVQLIYLCYLFTFPWFWGIATVEDQPTGSMSLRGWSVQFADTASQFNGLGVPDIIGIVIPFMYLVVTPTIICTYCLSGERSAYYFHVNIKSKRRKKVSTKRLHNDSGVTLKAETAVCSKVSPCIICGGRVRATLVILSLIIFCLHWRQCYFLKRAYGTMAVITSPGFSWPPPLLLATAIYTNWYQKTRLL